MTDLPRSAVCPFDALLDKRILGDLSAEDRAQLDEHLGSGCPSCSPRFKAEENLESVFVRAMEPMAREAAERRAPFLEKLRGSIEREEEQRRDRRRRRLGMNTALFLILMLGVALLSAEYFAYAAMRTRRVKAERAAADTEVHAIVSALAKLASERGSGAVPAERADLLAALAQKRRDAPERTYYGVDSSRIDTQTGLLLDPWGHPYVYRHKPDGVMLYSIGPNGVDEGGMGDDIALSLILSK